MSNFIPVLKQADLFHQFTPTQLELVANICSERSYRGDEIIFYEGADSDELFLIVDGAVDIIVRARLSNSLESFAVDAEGQSEKVIATLRRGQSFGEISLVDQGFRSATARTQHPGANLLIIPRDRIIQLCEAFPQLGYRLMRNVAIELALKIRSADLRIREQLLYGARQVE
jgi:CRP/FNR family cyclic AMP-dependent transcriptional regulator